MLEWLFSWEVTSWAVGILLAIAFGVLALDDYKAAKTCFLLATTDAAIGIVVWGIKTTVPDWARFLAVFVAIGGIGVLAVASLRYVDNKRAVKGRKSRVQIQTKQDSPKEPPSFLYVFGAPLGDNDSPIWIMTLRHYGPNPAFNCDVHFFDKDRKNIEHEWLVGNPKWPFPPPGIADGESQKSFHFAEAGPAGPVAHFQWSPVDPNRQHYTASIACRDGVFVENWEATRVNGTLRAKISVERGPDWVRKHPDSNPIIFTCTDPEFVSTPLASKLPAKKPPLIHPGWKPSHSFQVPAAIVDSNGNLQVLSGVTLPDGSQRTDFGCWNLLTRHLGDNPEKQ